jgi:hypothetical protein
MSPEQQPHERYRPLALIGVTLMALLGFAVFFLSFLVAPMAILVIFYVGFALSDRSKRAGGGKKQAADAAAAEAEEAPAEGDAPDARDRGSAALLAREAQWRRVAMERADAGSADER